MVQSLARLGLPAAAIVLGAALVLEPAGPAIADQRRTRAELSALAREMSTCSGFFALAASVLGRALPEDREVIERYDIGGKVLLAQAIASSMLTCLLHGHAQRCKTWSRKSTRTRRTARLS